MSSVLRRSRSSAVVVAMLLGACSSGGDSGPEGGGLSVSPGSLTFVRDDGSPPPPAQLLFVSVTDREAAYIGAGFPEGTTVPPWLSLSLSGSGYDWQVHVSIIDAVLPPGTYTATVRVGIAREDGSLIGYRDTPVTYTLRPGVAGWPASVAIGQTLGSSLSSTRQLELRGTSGLAFTAAADRPWVKLSASSGTVPATLTLSVDPAGLAAGTHEAMVTLTGGAQPIGVPVILTLSAPTLSANPSMIFSGTAGNGLSTSGNWLSLDVGTNAYAWAASGVPAWLQVSPASGSIGSGTIQVSFTPLGAVMPPGIHTADVAFTADVLGTPVTRTVTVTVNLAAPQITAPVQVVLGGESRHDLSAVPFEIQLGTGENQFPWTATTSASWAALSATSGTVSAAPVALSVAPAPGAVAALGAVSYEDTIVVTADVNGVEVTRSIPLFLVLDDHLLATSEDGVALTSLPSASVLSRSVRIRSNRGLPIDWAASSDRAWLTATASGTTDDPLVLSADPAALAADALHEATVTVSSSDPTIVGTRTIRVGLWKGSASPTDVSLPVAYTEIAADPIRPYLYATNGGADVAVYHVFTGALVRTLPSLGTALGALAVSGDGAKLFVVDEGSHAIVPVELASDAAGTPWPLRQGFTSVKLAHARPNGTSLLLASDGLIRETVSGTSNRAIYGTSGLVLSAARDGSAFCFVGPTCATLDATSGYPVVGGWRSGAGGSNAKDVALSADTLRVYHAAGHPYEFTVFDASGDGSLQPLPSLDGDAYPNAVEVGPDGRVYAAASSWYGPTDLWVYDAAGNLDGSFYVSGYANAIRDRGIAVSGDGLRVMVTTDDPTLQFLSAPP